MWDAKRNDENWRLKASTRAVCFRDNNSYQQVFDPLYTVRVYFVYSLATVDIIVMY